MNQISSKVYYEISTGTVLLITPEMQDEIKTTKEYDMKFYEQLKDKTSEEIDYIELPYGTLTDVVTKAKSFKVNLESKKLEVVYYLQEEINTMKIEYKNQIQIIEALDNSVSNISEYLKLDSTNITDIENYIIQQEQNKILGVV